MRPFSLRTLSLVTLLSSPALCTLLTGCGATPPSVVDPQPGVAIEGLLHGGQSPISGAHIYLMAANPTTFKGASTSLLTRGDGSDSVGFYVLTAADGSFKLTGDYTCTPTNQVYLLAMGGNPGMTPAVYNTAATQVALLGTCPSTDTFAGTIPYIVVNEVSTIAAAYSVAAFATDYAHIGSANTTTSQKGLANAFLSAGSIVALGYGQAYTRTPAVSGYSGGLSANGTVPQTKIYSLANSLGACVNSSGSTASGTPCGLLFSYTIYNGVTPTDVFDVTLNLAHSPTITTTNSGLYGLSPQKPAFYPALGSAPNDWTISIQYTIPNALYSARPAIDTSGDVWIPEAGTNSLAEVNTTGVVLSGTAGYTGSGLYAPTSISIDTTGTPGAVWASNLFSTNVSKFSLSGTPANATGYVTADGASYETIMKGSSPVFAGNNAVSILSSTGAVQSVDTPPTGNAGLTLDISGNIWSAQDATTITKLNSAGTGGTSYTGGGLSNPVSLSSDPAGDIWVANSTASRISEFLPSGTPASTSGYTGGGLLNPYCIRVDSAGHVFVGNTNGTISEFSAGTTPGSPAAGTALTGTTGYTTPSTASYISNPSATVYGIAPAYSFVGIAIDQSGNLWAPDVDGNLYKFIGLAAPVTP